MRNLKKILALVLALVMVMSMTVFANAADYTDADGIDAKYAEAVEVLSNLGVFRGTSEDNSVDVFSPTQNITRAEVAAVVYRALTADTDDSQAGIYSDYNKFSDVTPSVWFAGYVNYVANGQYVVGDGAGRFYPLQYVTGYQALAIVLRAIGYGQNGEFEGAGWEVRTATTAQQLGILKNINTGTLGQAATRQVVAEIVFRAIATVKQVDYTLAYGYQAGTNSTLAYDVFGLADAIDHDDVWGRPGHSWLLDNDKDPSNAVTYAASREVAHIADTPVATYTTKTTECDIAEDAGFTGTKNLEAAYIDGVKYDGSVTSAATSTRLELTSADVTGNRSASINALQVNSIVGAQGRLTEVYDMGNNTLRLVEINTYLAKVTAVTAATTDRNGHTIPGTVTFEVYEDNRSTSTTAANAVKTYSGYEGDGFAVGDYALVQVTLPNTVTTNKGAVDSATLTTPVTSGSFTRHTDGSGVTSATSIIGGTTYNDADKFVRVGDWYNTTATALYNNKVAALGDSWDVFVDQFGNVIGLVELADNYLVVERIEWKHNQNTYHGYAMADVVLADGTHVQNATVSNISGVAAKNVEGAGAPATGDVADNYNNNTQYYDHLTTYSVNADGTYNLNTVTPTAYQDHTGDLTGVTITTGVNTLSGTDSTNAAVNGTNQVVTNDNTVFLVKDPSTGAYTTYVGKDNVPDMSNATICYLLSNSGNYASLVLVTSWDQTSSNTFVGLYTGVTRGQHWIGGIAHTSYLVWNVETGVYQWVEVDPNAMYDETTNLVDYMNDLYHTDTSLNGLALPALMSITVDNSSVVTSAQHLLGANLDRYAEYPRTGSATLVDGCYWAGGWVKEAPVGNTLQIRGASETAVGNDLGLTNSTAYYVVTQYPNGDFGVAPGTIADLKVGDKLFVGYTGSNLNEKASYILVFKVSTDSQNVNTTPVFGKDTRYAAFYQALGITYTQDSTNAITINVDASDLNTKLASPYSADAIGELTGDNTHSNRLYAGLQFNVGAGKTVSNYKVTLDGVQITTDPTEPTVDATTGLLYEYLWVATQSTNGSTGTFYAREARTYQYVISFTVDNVNYSYTVNLNIT